MQRSVKVDQNQVITIQKILEKYQKTKFESLSLQDLAVATTTPKFPEMFQKVTGENWIEKYQIKAKERLNFANYDIQWYTRKANDQMKPLFSNTEKGQLLKIQEFIKQLGPRNKQEILNSIDITKKTPLHVACIQGYLEIVQYFVEYGFNINARDRTLKTPILYASLHGEQEIIQYLLQNGANIDAVDSGDKGILHLAATSNSPETVKFICQKKQSLVNSLDSSNLTPLHFSIQNITNKQIDIMRILLEKNSDPNAQDTDGATPLIHASRNGRIKACKILLMNGALVDIKDRKTRKNAIQSALNDNTRQTIILYSHKQIGNQSDLIDKKDQQLLENTLLVEKEKVKIIEDKEEVEVKEIPKSINTYNNKGQSPVSQFFRNKFYTMLKQLQEDGVKQWQHIQTPSIFTASWMENIQSLDDLYKMSKIVSGHEMLLRTFNILCPYDYALPIPNIKDDQQSEEEFYGKKWFELMSSTYHRSKLNVDQEKEMDDLKQKIQSLEDALEIQHDENNLLAAKNEDLILEIADYRRNKELYSKQLKDSGKSYESLIERLKKQLKEKEDQIHDLEEENNKLKIDNIQMKDSLENQMDMQLEAMQQKLEDKEKLLEEEVDDHKVTKKKALADISSKNDEIERLEREKREQIEKLEREKKELEERQRKEEIKKNLDPKEALINMHLSIEKIEPYQDIITRMKQCDIDKNNSLIPLEFMLFCERLKLVTLETQVLQKLAGILPEEQEKESVDIEQWKDISENHPTIQKIWNQRLFAQIINKLETRNIPFDIACKKMDVDGDGKLEPKELQKGLHTLKVQLNQKDFVNTYENLDEDGNGAIAVEEFQKVLENYKKEIQEPLKPELTFKHRFLIDHYDYNAPQLNEVSADNIYDGLNTEIREKRLQLTDDVNPINGNLMLQIPKGANLLNQKDLKQITIRTLLKGSGAQENELLNSLVLFDENDWNYSLLIPVRKVLKENVNDHLHVQLFENDDNLISDEKFLGEVKVLWKECIDYPETWHISQNFELKNRTFLKEHPKEVSGFLGVQVQWIPSTSEKFTGEVEENVDMMQIQPTRQSFKRSIVEEGMLEIIVVSAYLQEKKQKVKCQVILPDKKEKSFKAKYDANKQPYWADKCYVNLEEKANKENKAIKLKLIVDNGLLKSDDILGEVSVDWEECLDWVGDYQTRRAFLFKAHNQQKQASKIYVKVRWIPNSLYQKLTGYSEGSEKDKQNAIKNNKDNIQEGVLKVIVIQGQNLRADDGATSDPYAQLSFINYDDKIQKYQTKVKGKTLNPKWNEQFTFNISYFKDGPVPPLQVSLKDKDFSGDDDLGTVDIDLHDVVDQNCEWYYDDQFFDLDDPQYDEKKNPLPPQFQLSVYFVPEGKQDPNKKPKNWRDDKTVKGELKVNIVHAREIKIADSKASDPYTIIKFPNGKEFETSVISNSLNPIWNESFSQTVLVSQDRMDTESVPLKITVKDSDTLATDDVLGYCDIYWNKCIQKPGEWEINEIFELQGAPDIKKNLKTLGYIYVQIKFLEEGMQDDESKPVCIENLADIISKQQGLYKGNLRVFLVHGKNLIKTDDGDKDFSDPFAIFKVPGGKKVQSKIIKDSLNPEWKTIYKIPVNMPMDTIQPMRVEIFDDDLIGNDLMGYLSVDLQKSLQNPNKWAINEIYKLQGDSDMKKKFKTEVFGELYMQIMFTPDGINNEDPPLPLTEDLSEALRKKKEDDKTPMDGLLKVNIVFARGLKMADKDSSDPYCEVTFPNKKTISTKQIDADLNPIWNFQHNYMIKFNKEDYKPLKFVVKDKDTMAVDDTLGQVEVEWMDCFNNPTMWQINQLFKLQGETKTGEDLGDIYIQIQYQRLTDIENPEAQTICKTNPDVFEQYGRVLGQLEISIISGLDLKNEDWGGKSDPFVQAYFSDDNSKKLKTPVIQDNLNPEWNFDGKFYIDILRCQVKEKSIIFDLFDDDNLSSNFIGQTQIDIIECLEKPGVKYEEDYTLYDPKKKDSNTNFGTLKISYKWLPDKDCESIEGLRQPEKIFKGDLFIRIVNCKDLKKKMQSFVYFELTNNIKKSYVTKKRKDAEINPEYDHKEIIPLEIGERKYKTLKAHFRVVEDGFVDSTLGGFTFSLREIMDNPGKWINQYEKIRGKNEEKQFGFCYIQIQFRPENDKSIKTDLPEEIDYTKFISVDKPKTLPGQLFVNIVGARKIPTSSLDKSDPFCKIICSKGAKKIIQTKTIDDNLSPIWQHQDNIPLDLVEEDYQNIYLNCQVYDYDYASNDLLGTVEIDISQLFQKSGDWINQIYPLLDTKGFPGAGELYLQIQWRPEVQKDTIKTDLPENLLEKEQQEQEKKEEEKRKKEEEENKIPDLEGQLFVKVYQAFNILKSDSFSESDGIVIIKINKGTKEILKTQEIENDKNPKFDKDLIFNLKAKPQELQKNLCLSATLEDVDTEGNDFLGYLEVNIDNLIQKPGDWYNQISQLCDSKGTPGKNGLIYLLIQWRPKDMQEIKTELPELLNISSFYKGEKPVGFMVIKVISAKNILGVENKGQSSDAKLKLLFNKKNQITKVQKSLNPQWKEQFYFEINFNDRSEIPFLKCELYDHNTFSDDFLGDFETNISETLEKPNEWGIQKEFVFANLEKRKVKGDINGNCLLWISFCKSKQDIEKLKQE